MEKPERIDVIKGYKVLIALFVAAIAVSAGGNIGGRIGAWVAHKLVYVIDSSKF